MMKYDLSAFSGHWPFRYLRESVARERLDAYERLGFSGGLMASLDAIFYNDPWEGDGRLLEALKGTPWRLALCVNPALPWAEQALLEAHRQGLYHIRLYPGIHGYPPERAEPVFCLARELGMTVTVTARLEDSRLCYLLDQQQVNAGEYAALAAAYPGVKALLSGFYLGELTGCGSLLENLWADTSGLCHGLAPVEELLTAGFSEDRLVFGSLSPLQSIRSHLLNLPEHCREKILDQNPKRFLEVE